ncbi:hypothetical protein [Demequina litorisediminis]|uniref:Uncharacterized protein n=1 Tax=Demequina litorisediminis TaxID=1849022 RepID=A0ABQ6IKD4_9MICO|nr:hypothetical protein [Demequina litorisediminis]GMA37785.1 hypothetical protein GCM10025876_39890 [Demequina litorisediminis]GMA37845.1 hypothetical protein GCM10025876_40490 [Demequina litorisediminis]GMA37895.1 hypothetical protein GCM10025876_40990 [Demequina litorisediminis]
MLTTQERTEALYEAATAVGDAKRHELATAAGALIAHALSMCPDAHRVYLIDTGESDRDAYGMIVDEIECPHHVIATSACAVARALDLGESEKLDPLAHASHLSADHLAWMIEALRMRAHTYTQRYSLATRDLDHIDSL